MNLLIDKLNTLNTMSNKQVIIELNQLLNRPRNVTISWYGQTLVSIEGYTGVVDINQFVQKYLHASPQEEDGYNNLQERLDFYNLWAKIKTLCKDETALNRTSVFKYLVPIKDIAFRLLFRPAPVEYIITPLKGTKFPSKDEWCFSFYPDDFKKVWPNDEAPGWKLVNSKEIWIATKKMVENKLSNQ